MNAEIRTKLLFGFQTSLNARSFGFRTLTVQWLSDIQTTENEWNRDVGALKIYPIPKQSQFQTLFVWNRTIKYPNGRSQLSKTMSQFWHCLKSGRPNFGALLYAFMNDSLLDERMLKPRATSSCPRSKTSPHPTGTLQTHVDLQNKQCCQWQKPNDRITELPKWPNYINDLSNRLLNIFNSDLGVIYITQSYRIGINIWTCGKPLRVSC